MEKRNVIIALLILIIIVITTFILSQNDSVYQGKAIDQGSNNENLENLKLKANVECLQNSQCSDNFECVGNKCVKKIEINLCQEIKLSTNSIPLEIGKPINLAKKVLTRKDLPYLLSDGEIVEIINNNITEYFYSPVILISKNSIEKEDEDYFITTNEPIYTYRLMFSNSVDFSSENIKGQALRILGKEYVIDNKSDNNKIILISNNKKIQLEDGKKAKIKEGLFFDDVKGNSINVIKNEEGKVIILEILFNMQDKDSSNIKVKENYFDPVFNAIKLSFDDVDINNFADVRIGGDC